MYGVFKIIDSTPTVFKVKYEPSSRGAYVVISFMVGIITLIYVLKSG